MVFLFSRWVGVGRAPQVCGAHTATLHSSRHTAGRRGSLGAHPPQPQPQPQPPAMKKLFGKNKKPEFAGALYGKTVQVGPHHVRVEELVGEGGFACIYKVRDAENGKPYALKHLRLAADPEHIQEVQREAKTQVRLRGHPNILRLYAVAFAGPKGQETDGFFLMDYCSSTLIELMHRGELHEEQIMEIFSCVCNGVAHMHSQNPPLAHR